MKKRQQAVTGRGLRKRLLLLALLVVPVFVVPLFAEIPAATLLEKIPVIGGSRAVVPAATNPTMFFGSIVVGIIAGLITGVIGAGGGYILTPALMSFGVRGIMAVGTDQFHLFAKAIMGTAIHHKMGNVNTALAAWFVAGSLVGVTAGGAVNRAVFNQNPVLSDALISVVYVVVLGGLSVSVIVASARARHTAVAEREAPGAFATWLQSLPLKPRIRFDQGVVEGGRSIAVYPVILCGLIVGFVASIMGVGGGFLTFPMFVYGLGVSSLTTVGTDILQIIFTTWYSSIIQYAIYGYIFYTIAIGMLLGSLVGVQIGALVTKMVSGSRIRLFYALTVLAGFANRLFALPRKMAELGYAPIPRSASIVIEKIGTFLFFAIVGIFSLWILAVFARNLGAMRAASGASRLVVDRRKVILGSSGLAAFAAVFCVIALPIFGGRSFLGVADDLFNRLTKHSAIDVPAAEERAAAFAGVAADFAIAPREFAEREKLLAVASANGLAAAAAADGRLRLRADLSVVAAAMLRDARSAFENRGAELERRYGLSGEEVIYCWWTICNGFVPAGGRGASTREARFVAYVSAKVLEPTYNFRGIEARDIHGSALPAALLLAAYVLYTLWYGFSLLLLLEGLGIEGKRAKVTARGGRAQAAEGA